MLDLPIDLQLQIIDYVVTHQDLKTLCLTSRRYHSYVIPRLYERINVRTWDKNHTARFMHCVAAGANNNFHHTRILVIEDEPMVAEPACEHTAPRLLHHNDWCRRSTVTVGGQNDLLSTILNLFPEHGLRRFCFVARRSLPLDIIEHLQTKQRAIDQLYCPSGSELLPLFTSLRRLHLLLLGPSHLAQYLQDLSIRGDNIEHLSLDQHSEYQELELPGGLELTRILPRLKRLTVSGIAITYDVRKVLLNMLSLPSLTHLDMLNCWGDDKIAADLGLTARETEINLEHIAINLNWLSGEKQKSLDTYLGDLLNFSKHIKSLHLKWFNPLPSHQSLSDKICAMGSQLELLSLHETQDCSTATPLWPELFDTICKSCPNLRQLGYQFDEATYVDDDVHDELDSFIESIKLLKDLQIVHIRLSSYFKIGLVSDDGEPDPKILMMQIQRVANKIFAELYRDRSCLKLDAIVIGHMEDFDPYRDDQGWGPLPQFCFVKAEQRDQLGRVTAVGVPVSRMLLRRTQPYTEILDLDPGTDSFNRWAWLATS